MEQHTPSTLDTIKLEKGVDGLKSFFSELSRKDYGKAAGLVNEESLHFGSFYILMPLIDSSGLSDYLSPRNKIAAAIVNEALLLSKSMPSMNCSSSEYIQTVCSVLKWILTTGSADDGLEDAYDKVLDASSALLAKVYGDRSVLKVIADMIFERNRRRSFYYDLIWAFFESKYPHGLILIADYLLSEQTEDVRLAQRLLGFIPGIGAKRAVIPETRYLTVLQWLENNHPYLYYTGECFQQTPNPKPYRIVLKAKYLGKAVSIDTGKTIEPLTEYERKLLGKFSGFNEDVKIMLSEYSQMLRNNNIQRWYTWIHRPLAEQVEIAGMWTALQGGGAV